jgi:hypothetical protein
MFQSEQLDNPLAYPAGRAPGFDPSHPAMARANGRCRLSVFASGASFINLLNGAPGTVTGAINSSVIDGALGPATAFTNSGTGIITYPTPTGVNDTMQTIAVLVRFTTLTVNYQTIVSGPSGAVLFTLNPSNLLGLYFNFASAFVSSGLTPVVNVPYLAIASYNTGNTTANFLLLNLKTGQIQTATVSSASVSTVASSGTYGLGSTGNANQGLGGNLAVGTIIPNYLSPQELAVWAADPWSFWYPK